MYEFKGIYEWKWHILIIKIVSIRKANLKESLGIRIC